MNDKRRVFVNALMSSAQVVVNGAAFLVLYRYLLETIGDQQAGVWALVLSWTAAMSVADLGMTGGAVKFVSRYLALNDRPRVRQVVETSVVSVAVILLVLLPPIYPLLERLLRLVVEPASHIDDALAVLPYAVVSFWLTSVGGIIQSCIDGTRRVYVRNILVMGSALLYLGLAFLLVPRGGLIGLAQAQVIQAAVVLVAAWILVKVLIPGLPLIPAGWNASVFKEMFSYSINFQISSVAQFLFQPLTKSLISKFGGVGPVFYFEMAHKLVAQLRALVVMAHQSLVPTIAHLHETSREKVQGIYVLSFQLLLFLVAGALPLFIALTPIISKLWIGEYEGQFITFAMLLFVAWFLNILSNPAYFGYLGIGRLRWNVWGHVVTGVLNAGIGIFLGIQYGGVGVVAAYGFAILVGSAIPPAAYHLEYGVRWSDLLQVRTLFVALSGLAGLVLVLVAHELLRSIAAPVVTGLILGVLYAAVVSIPAWRHPMRKRLQGWLSELRPRRESVSESTLSQ